MGSEMCIRDRSSLRPLTPVRFLSSLFERWLAWLSRLSRLGLLSWRRLSSSDSDLPGVFLLVDLDEVAWLALLLFPSLLWDRREFSIEPGQFQLAGPWFVGFPL